MDHAFILVRAWRELHRGNPLPLHREVPKTSDHLARSSQTIAASIKIVAKMMEKNTVSEDMTQCERMGCNSFGRKVSGGSAVSIFHFRGAINVIIFQRLSREEQARWVEIRHKRRVDDG